MLDTSTGELEKRILRFEEGVVRELYSQLPRPVRVGPPPTGKMQCFVNLMEELGIECLVGHPAEIRAAEPRKQKHDRRDADLLLSLLVEERFPSIWLPTKELLDIRALVAGTACGWSAARWKLQMRCRRLPWRMACDAVPRCGPNQDNAPSRLCRTSPHAAYRRR